MEARDFDDLMKLKGRRVIISLTRVDGTGGVLKEISLVRERGPPLLFCDSIWRAAFTFPCFNDPSIDVQKHEVSNSMSVACKDHVRMAQVFGF